MIFALPLYDDNPTVSTPVVTWGVIGLCVGAFLWQLGQPDAELVTYQYGMVPAILFGYAHLPPDVAILPGWATIFTSMFLHGGWIHLGGNMLFLWIFGNNIEDVLGATRYLFLYFVSGIAAALAQALTDPSSQLPMIGASGAIAGVLGAYLVLYPRANVHVFVWIIIFFRIIAVPAWLMLGLWFTMQLVSGLTAGANSPGVAFWAHVGGFVSGALLLLILRPRGVGLWQAQKTPVFATAPAHSLAGRRMFHGGSVPETGSNPFRPRGP